MTIQPSPGFGLWTRRLSTAERRARWRAMRSLAIVFCGPAHPFVAELREAEHSRTAARRALALLDALAPLSRRRLLAVDATVHRQSARPIKATPVGEGVFEKCRAS